MATIKIPEAIMWRCTKCRWQFGEEYKYCPRCGNIVESFNPLNDAPQMP